MFGRLDGSEDQISETHLQANQRDPRSTNSTNNISRGGSPTMMDRAHQRSKSIFFFTFGSTNKNKEPSLIPFSILSLQLFTLDKLPYPSHSRFYVAKFYYHSETPETKKHPPFHVL